MERDHHTVVALVYNVQCTMDLLCVWNTDGHSRGMTHRTMVTTAIVLSWNCTRVEWMHRSTFFGLVR